MVKCGPMAISSEVVSPAGGTVETQSGKFHWTRYTKSIERSWEE